jgi:hypothetical protein
MKLMIKNMLSLNKFKSAFYYEGLLLLNKIKNVFYYLIYDI